MSRQSGDTESFPSYLSCHPFVYSAMYNPLHCALISQLYIIHWEKERKSLLKDIDRAL